MNANWYVDPLGRFEGRYWDGSNWTDQVKDRGQLAVDPDWPPLAFGAERLAAESRNLGRRSTDDPALRDSVETVVGEPPTLDADVGPEVTSISIPGAQDQSGQFLGQQVGAEGGDAVAAISYESPDDLHGVAPIPDDVSPSGIAGSDGNLFAPATSDAAVSALDVSTSSPAAGTESPTRTVARLDNTTDASGAVAPRSERGVVVHTAPSDPVDESGSSRKWLWALGAAVVLAGLLLFLLPKLASNNDTASTSDTTELDSADSTVDEGVLPATGDEGESSGEEQSSAHDSGAASDDSADAGNDVSDQDATTSDGDTDSDSDHGESDSDSATDTVEYPAEAALALGTHNIVNGTTLIHELEDWHIEAMGLRGEDLQTQCWLGRIGEAAVQAAHCGPVGVSDDGEAMFDLVPLHLIEYGDTDGEFTAKPLLDAAEEEVVLPAGLTLVGIDGELDASTIEGGPAAKSGN